MFYDANGNILEVKDETIVKPYNLVVMCFNVQRWEGLNSNHTLLKEIVDTYKPDVIGVQECTRIDSNDSIFSKVFVDYPYHYYSDTIYNPVCVVSKYELTDVSTILYQNQGAETRGYTKTYFEFNQQTICLINTHLEVMGDNGTEIRTLQGSELLEAMKTERYAICTGDFNVGDCHDKTDENYTAVIKPFIDEGYHSANSSDQHGFLATYYDGTSVNEYTRYACIDEIITTSNIDINIVVVDKQKSDANITGMPLDHLPIVAYCRVN